MTFYVMFSTAFSMYCTNGLLNLPICVQLSVRNPLIVVKGLIIMNHFHGSRALHSLNSTFHPEQGFLVLDGPESRQRKQMLVLEQCQDVQETWFERLEGAREQRESEKFAF